jgi:hypothetical protein
MTSQHTSVEHSSALLQHGTVQFQELLTLNTTK